MANFHTHLTVAASASGVLATSLLVTEVVSPSNVVVLFLLGTAGGLLPDVDSQPSIPIRITFTLLALIGAFMMMFHFSTYSLVELLMIWLLSYASIRYLLFDLFTSITVHRGLVHSLPAAVMVCLMGVMVGHYIFHLTAVFAWFCGLFLGFGFIVHLVLDEVYSANLLGVKQKKPFGSALCFGSFKTSVGKLSTLVLYLSIVYSFHHFTPPLSAVGKIIGNGQFYNHLGQRLLPSGQWFKGLL